MSSYPFLHFSVLFLFSNAIKLISSFFFSFFASFMTRLFSLFTSISNCCVYFITIAHNNSNQMMLKELNKKKRMKKSCWEGLKRSNWFSGRCSRRLGAKWWWKKGKMQFLARFIVFDLKREKKTGFYFLFRWDEQRKIGTGRNEECVRI